MTGASRGLGRSIALALANAGAELVVVARNEADLEQTAEAIRESTGRPALVCCADVTSAVEVEDVRARTENRFGAATVLVNAAAVFGPLALFSQTDPDDWVRALIVNTAGPYLTCRAFVPAMLAAERGRIVNLSSAASLYPPGLVDSAYSTSKTALNRLTRHLAAELEGTGVSAVVVHPGSVKTEMWADIRDKVAQLGPEGDAHRDWVARVEETGGDSSSGAGELVLGLVDPRSDGHNGEFCWLDVGLEKPVPSW